MADAAYASKFSVGGSANVCDMLVNSNSSGCRIRELNSFLLQKYSSAYIGQWCPNGLDGKNQEVECHQQKTDWKLNDV